MDFLNLVIMGSVSLFAVLTLLIFVIMKQTKRKAAKNKEKETLKGIGLGIGNRLHAAYPGSKWRWVCCPAGFADNGGIARIDVLDAYGNQHFIDVCFSADENRMALHEINAVALKMQGVVSGSTDIDKPTNKTNDPVSATVPKTCAGLNNEESVDKWFNIVLIDTLTTLIDDLNAQDEVCLYIDKDGKAYAERSDNGDIVYEFGEMPDIALWGCIIDKLGLVGLFAEVQEGNRIFISWA